MFNIKRPCRDCPFRKEERMLQSLAKGRMEEIVTNVVEEDGFFPCHKTIDYSVEWDGLQSQNQFCAGALIAIEKANATARNRNTRMAIGFGMYDPDELQDMDSVIEPENYLGGNKDDE